MDSFTLIFRGDDKTHAVLMTKRKGIFATEVEQFTNGDTLMMEINPLVKVGESPAPGFQQEIPSVPSSSGEDNGSPKPNEPTITPEELWAIIEDRMEGLHDASPRLSFYLKNQLTSTGLNLNQASKKTRKRVSASKIGGMIRQPPEQNPPQFQGLKIVMFMKDVLEMKPDVALEVLEQFDVLSTTPEEANTPI